MICVQKKIDANKRLSGRLDRFLSLLQKVVRRRHYAPRWINEIVDTEDRLFASFLFFGVFQDWLSGKPEEMFYKTFEGKWSKFIELMENLEYEYLQTVFKNIKAKGHVKRIKGHIYGSKKKGGFQKSIPFQYYDLMKQNEFSQQSFFNRNFSKVCEALVDIEGVGRTVSFDIASGAYVIAQKELANLEPDRIYLKGSTGPLKGFTMLLSGVREESWAKAKKITSRELGIKLDEAEDAVIEIEKYLVDQSFNVLSQRNPRIRRFEALLELEDLICNYQKALGKDNNHPKKYLEGKTSLADYSKLMKNRYYNW